MEAIRVLVVDDHPLFAEALTALLGRESDLQVLPPVHDAEQAGAAVAAGQPDVVLLDLSLGEASGIDVLDHLRAHHPAVRVVMLTANQSQDKVLEAVRHGADAWLSKTTDAGTLVRVVRGVIRGESWIPPEMLGGVLRRLVAPVPSNLLDRLTPREREILQALVDGKVRGEIADELFLSANTVRTHTQNLLAKLEVHSVLEAVALALRCGMRPTGQRPNEYQ